MATNQSSWKVGQWTTPQTTVTTQPVPSEVSAESKSQISHNISGQFAAFIQDEFPTFVEFVKAYYKSQELKGYCFDIINNWGDYYNIDNYGNLVAETELISSMSTTSTTVDVTTTRDFPDEGLLMIDDEIIYYKNKGQTIFNDCARGVDAVKAVGDASQYLFANTTTTVHTVGSKVINLNNLFPFFMLGQFKDQYLSTYPKNFATGVTESTIIKRIKDFYASKGTTRSFQFVLRTLFGVDSEVSYPRDRIFKPSDAYYTAREVIRATAVSGNPMDLVGQVLYQEDDTTDPYVNAARIYVKGVQKVFTASGEIFEIDVDTNNSSGTFVTPYKTTVASDVSNALDFTTITVDSTLGWPEQNGRFRIQDEIITYTDKTVNQFLGCTRARENTIADEHIAGQEAFAAFRIYGQSNVDGSDIQIKVFGGTRGVNLTDGGKYYLPESKVTTPLAPGFDSLDPIWDSFQYNVRKALRGVTAELATPTANGSVRVTVTTLEKHRLRRDDKVRILNAAEDIYNNEHDVIGIIDEFKFEFILTSSPSSSILSTDPEFFISREFAFGTSVYTSINTIISGFTADVQNVYKSTDHAIVASTGVPSHKIGPFASTAPDIGNQRYLKRIPLVPSTKSTKTPTPVGQIGIGVNGVPFFSYKGLETKKYGGIISITKVSGGDGYDILNPPTVEFEPDYKLHTIYATGQIVKYNDNGTVRRYKALNPGTSDKLLYPTHTTGNFQVGSILWEYLGLSAAATAVIDGRVIAINVTSGGSGYITQPLVSITGGGASNTTQATAVAQITDGSVTGINVISGGSGYTKDAGLPTISISGGGGAGASATSVVRGPISAINITDAGSQFTYEPSITLKSGSGAVGYASILNGQIVSIIVTYGGADYFGAPDVVITGDGVGATAFAIVDSVSKQVTSVTVTNKGVGYTAGNTQISIVYPGTGANFTTNLTLLTYNEAATAGEIQKNDPSAVFSDRKVIDDASGTIVSGENIGIYGGEYGYFYNPNNLRYYLGDSVETRTPTTQDPSPWIEQNPTGHSPIIGWAYDGHPIYGPYGYEDAQNQNPYNSYVQPATSYRIKAARASILSGLTDPMGTFIEDYEYVQGLGNLDEYNGRYCVTPEYPNGVYAYFCTIDGVSGEPKFPYFIGSNFYSEADEVNWDGNGLQKNFTEDATRYRAPYIGTDNVTAKRKTLDSRIDFLLALEDSTTLITLESGEILQYIEDGIGYFSYYPTIRGGIAESLSVAATNRYSSNNIDSYLVEGGGTGYKVNDRLIFDNTDTGGAGVSATVSTVTGSPVSALNYIVGDDDKTTATISTTENHYLVAGDAIVVSFGNNAFEREIKVKEYYNKFYFEYFNLVSMDLLTPWTNSTSYNKYDLVYVADRVYQAAETATSNSNSGNAPTHLTGTLTDGTMTWTYVRRRTDGNLVQDSWTLNSGGTSYLTGTYNDVPLTTNNSGKDAKATIVVNNSGVVTNVTITAFGTAFNVGDTISAADVNLGANGGSGLQLTLTETEREAVCRADAAHQVEVGDSVWVQGVTPSTYDKGDYTVIRTETPRRFTIKRNFANPATATITSADVLIQEPKFQYINGHSYKFDTSDATLNGMTLAFSLDPSNTDIFTYKNVTEEIVDSNTNEQTSITIKMVDLPGIFYYFDLAGNNSVTGSYFTIINEPLSGTNVLLSKTDTTASYVTALEPETNYTTANSIIYSTNSIYPTGGVSTISVGDSGRNYQSLPQLTGSSRSGAGATAVATISGVLSGVTVTNKGSGYNSNSLPTGVCTLPDFVDLTLTNVLGSGSFAVNEIIISQEVQGSQTARGRVLNWDPQTSTVRIQPLQNARTGAANKGYIMFTTLATNADRGKIYSSESQANISAVSGTQAAVLAVVPGSGPDVGSLSEVTIVGPGSNYRLKPSVIFDAPYYGQAKTVTISDDVTGHTPGEYTGVTQSSVSPVGGINVEFKVVIGAGGTIDSVTVTNGGSTYQLGSLITVLGSQIGGSSDNAIFNVTELTHTDVASTLCVLNGAVDSITVTNTGSGYLSAPEVVVSGGSGIQAKFNASIKNQGISAITIESGGQLFQNAPVVNISQKTGKGASILLKSTDMGEILKIGGDNITFNYSHDRTLKPELNTTYNLQLTRTQVLNYLDVTDGGANFVAIPEIVLTGGSGSLFVLDPIIENEVIQSVEVINPGRGFLSAPTVNAKITHKWVALKSSSTLNFPYNAKIPTGTKVTLNENVGTFPTPLVVNTTYYAIAATSSNGLADNQMRLATTLANAIAETYIVFTSDPIGDGNGLTSFTLSTTDLGDIITAYMKPANFLVGERVYQGTSTTIFTAYGIIKNWDSRGRVLSVEIIEGDFVVGEPVFGEESSAFGEIHAFDRAEATFNVSPISTSAEGWERTTGFLDVNEQRLYDSDRFQEYSYEISSPINISKWKNPLKFATHPAGFKVVGTQVILESSAKVYRAKSTVNPNYSTSEPWAWWVTASQPNLETFNGTTYVFPKPSAKSTGKFATIKNFGLGDPDYTAAVPTEVQVFGRQLLDVQKILSCVSHKIDDISSGFNDTTKSFNLRVGGLTVTAKIGKTSVTSQFFVLINGIVQNPENYTITSDVITFTDAPKASSTCLIMYYDRASYTSSFVLDQVGDEIKTFGTGLSGLGTHTFVSGVTNAITAGGGGSGTYTAASGTTYNPSTGVLVIEIGAHSLTTSNWVTIADGGITFTCDADNHASTHAYPRSGDPASGKQLAITAEDATTITVNVGISNNEPAELDGGTGYSDGIYNAVPLKNRLGSGSGATANITVTNGSVSNVKLNAAGNGYTNTDVVSISDPRVGEQLVKHFIPTNGTYTPADGVMVLTIGSDHGLSAPSTHTPTSATYDPNTGLMVITLANHGFVNGDQVKFADGAVTFSCAFGGATGAAAEKSYPRSTDYASDRWLQVFDVTTNTYTVQVLDTIPSTNVDPHTFVSAVTNGVKKAVSTVRIANESLQFSCGYGGGGTASYPRPTDPLGTQGKMRDIPVEAVAATTITVNALNGTTPTNTDAHTWVGLSTYQYQPTGIAYTPATGEMVLTKTSHGLIKGDRIRFATNSLTFTCALDNNQTQHTYPRVGDPSEGAWHTIDAVTNDTFTVFVGVSSDTSTHTFVSATSTAVERAVVSYGVYAYSKGADAGSLLRTNQNFIATTAYGRMMADNSGFSSTYQVKCIRDTNLLIDAVADNVEFGGNDATYDAANFYVGTAHLSGEEGQSVQVFNHARDICRQVMRNLTVTTNSYTVGTQSTDSTISNDSGSTSYSEACCIDTASTITTLWAIVTQAVGTGAHTWAGGTASNAVQSGGNYAHTFVSAVANGVTSNVGNLPNPVTNVAYTPSTGNMVITSNAHLLSTSNTLTIADNALSFTCAMDGNTATKTYPRSTDPVSGQTITITGTTTNTITVNVGASPIVNHDVTNATYDNSTGVLVLTIGTHSLTAGTSVKIANNSLSFTCANDNNTSVKTYPRPSDPYYDTAINIDSVVANTSITLNVGTNNGNLTGITRTSSQSPYFQVGVADVTFDGNDKTFTMLSGGSTQVLPASDNFLIFLNSTLQIKGSISAYTYTGSEITFTEAPLAGMDFYGFYFGKLVLLDDISPFFDNTKATFTMKQNTEPFSLESDNPDVVPANNLMIFINGVFQEPNIAYTLNGSIIKFSEAPRANSTCSLFIYVGSNEDVFISNTFNSIDPTDRMQVASEGSDRSIATISSASSVDTYEYVGLKPTTASFSAQISNGKVTGIIIDNAGSNYEDPPILLIRGGSGIGASATTTIQQGSGKVTSVTITNPGNGYLSIPTVTPVHPVHLERTARNRLISNATALGTTYLTTSINTTDTTLQCQNIYYDTSQKIGFPDEGEVLIPFYDTSVTPNRWNVERILYGAKNTSSNTLTVATGGRGYRLTTAAAHNILTATYTMSQSSKLVTVTTSANHNFTTGENRVFLDFTSGTNVNQVDNNPASATYNYVTYLPKDGVYDVTVTGVTTFTITIAEELRRINPHPGETTITPYDQIYLDTGYPATITGNVSLLPEVRLRSL